MCLKQIYEQAKHMVEIVVVQAINFVEMIRNIRPEASPEKEKRRFGKKTGDNKYISLRCAQ